MGIEPTPSAWKAEVLPLNYTRNLLALRASTLARHPPNFALHPSAARSLVEGEGFEPSKA